MRRQSSQQASYSPIKYQSIRTSHEQLNFIQKAYDLVDNPNNSEIIHWSKSGLTFIIQDIQKFEKQLLPLYFRHNRYQSFVRQLNMYDFHKIRNGDYYCDNKSQFRHEEFSRGNLETIAQIKRKGFQAKLKQKQNTKIKKCLKINNRKKINRKPAVIKNQVLKPILSQNSFQSQENSFFAGLPKLCDENEINNKRRILEQMINKIIFSVLQQIENNQNLNLQNLKANRISYIIEIAELIKEKWLNQFKKISGSQEINSLKDLYYKVKQQILMRRKISELAQQQKSSRQIRSMEQELANFIEQQDAVIQSIFRAEIRSTLICITSETFLNGHLHKKIDTFIGM